MTWYLKKKSRLFWFLRDLWHHPHFYGETMYSELPRRLNPSKWEDSFWSELRFSFYYYSRSWGCLRRDFLQVWRWLFWRQFAMRQPFCCKGNRRSWQTDLCDYLEGTARRIDDEIEALEPSEEGA